ncbi:MAG TPA: hypothetical protein DCL07_05170 [Cryomorphaceae bacterium]|nr:hypothetical protein [Cryomorphaceae bacterium]
MMKIRPPKIRPFLRSVHLTHRFYRISGGYKFLVEGFRKLGLGLLAFGLLVWLLNTYVVDLEALAEWVTGQFHWSLVVIILGLSEIVTGILPPDFFILWAGTFTHPWAMLALLSVASYGGGIMSYLIGQRLHRLPKIKSMVDIRFARHFLQIKRFGGLLIFLAALTPLPFPPVCTVAGVVNFRFSWFLWVSTARFVRFFLYAWFIFGIV